MNPLSPLVLRWAVHVCMWLSFHLRDTKSTQWSDSVRVQISTEKRCVLWNPSAVHISHPKNKSEVKLFSVEEWSEIHAERCAGLKHSCRKCKCFLDTICAKGAWTSYTKEKRFHLHFPLKLLVTPTDSTCCTYSLFCMNIKTFYFCAVNSIQNSEELQKNITNIHSGSLSVLTFFI